MKPFAVSSPVEAVFEFLGQMSKPGKVGIFRIVGGSPVRLTFIDADPDDAEAFDRAFPKGGPDAKSTP
jgi:hypothetical protein